MNSTNVHQNDLQCVGGYITVELAREEIEMLPEESGKSPTRLSVKSELSGMEIPVSVSELHKDGKLVAEDGTVVANFSSRSYKRIKENQAKRAEARTKKVEDKTR